jgi:APA family basic amino acid/polyamine antiporter
VQPGGVKLARKLTTFDATLIVMGGMVGSGIFLTPPLIAQAARTAPLIVAAWIFGGIIALAGAFIFAELAWRRPAVAGVYGYLRDGIHPAVAFTAGWTALLVSYSGAMAASAVAFAAYFQPVIGLHTPLWIVAAAVLLLLTFVNCLGVRPGSLAQNILMVLKIGVIAAIILAGFFGPVRAAAPLLQLPANGNWLWLVGAAMVPVLFAYDGWQTAPFIDEEMRAPLGRARRHDSLHRHYDSRAAHAGAGRFGAFYRSGRRHDAQCLGIHGRSRDRGCGRAFNARIFKQRDFGLAAPLLCDGR